MKHYLNVLYDNAKLDHLPEVPQFHYLATSLTSGQLCAFSKNQWLAMSAHRSGANFAGVQAGYLELSRVVAASAAFPPMFPPIPIRAVGLNAGEIEVPFRSTHYLTDGGIFDNLGVAEILHLIDNLGLAPEQLTGGPIVRGGFTGRPGSSPPERPSCVIVSDASASFDAARGGRFASIISRTSRATDILMARLAKRDLDSLHREMSDNPSVGTAGLSPIIHLPIEHAVQPFEIEHGSRYEPQSTVIQKGIRYVRTDLDRFDSQLIWYLMRHGYEVAAHAMHRRDQGLEIKAFHQPADLHASFDIEDQEKLEQFINRQQFRSRPDNLYGLVSLPYGLLGALFLLFAAIIAVGSLARLASS